MSTLIMAEKRDAAESIAAGLGLRKARGGFEGTLHGEPVFLLTATGHLLTLKTPDEVKPDISWNDPSTLIDIPRTFPMGVTPDSPNRPPSAQPRAYLSNIEARLRNCKRFIIATDSDREGEAIGWHVLEHFNFKGQVQRAWLAKGLDKKSIVEIFNELRPPEVTKGWFRASEARARSDWAFMFLVRAYTYLARYGAFGDLLGEGRGREGVMSVGRVQTPALAMIVAREREIRNFVSVDHFRVIGDFELAGSSASMSYRPVVTQEIIEAQPPGVTWDPQPPKQDGTEVLDKPLFVDKGRVEAFEKRLMAAGHQASVTGFRTRTRLEQPPKTFSLTDGQLALGKALKVSGALAQTILEDLYEQGWMSYARTSKSELPMNLYEPSERNAYLNAVQQLPGLAESAKTAQAIHNGEHPDIQPFVPKVFTNKDMEHWGMTPTHQVMTPTAFANLTPRKAEKGSPKHTREHMQQAYLLMARQYVQALFPPAQWAVQEMSVTVPAEDLLGASESQFYAKGERLKVPGWRAAFGEGLDKDTSLPLAKELDKAKLKSVTLSPSKTTPPSRYTSIGLPKAMEGIAREIRDPQLRKLLKDSEGIGTPASRKAAILTLTDRDYVVEKKDVLYPTPKGEAVFDSVETWLRAPETTALWEDKLVAICKERDDQKAVAMRDEFVEEQVSLIEGLIRDLIERHKNNLRSTPVAPVPSKVTPKMKSAMKSVAERKGISLPKGTLSDPVKAKAFLDEHLGQREGNAPSPAALDYARNLVAHLPNDILPPENWETDRSACAQLIEMAKPYQPPQPKALAFAERLLNEMPENERPDPAFLKSATEVSAFIDSRLGKSKGRSSPSKSASSRKTASSGRGAPARKPSSRGGPGSGRSKPRGAPF